VLAAEAPLLWGSSLRSCRHLSLDLEEVNKGGDEKREKEKDERKRGK